MTRKRKTIGGALCLFAVTAILTACFVCAFGVPSWEYIPTGVEIEAVDARYWLWRDGSVALRLTEHSDGSKRIKKWRKR